MSDMRERVTIEREGDKRERGWQRSERVGEA